MVITETQKLRKALELLEEQSDKEYYKEKRFKRSELGRFRKREL